MVSFFLPNSLSVNVFISHMLVVSVYTPSPSLIPVVTFLEDYSSVVKVEFSSATFFLNALFLSADAIS